MAGNRRIWPDKVRFPSARLTLFLDRRSNSFKRVEVTIIRDYYLDKSFRFMILASIHRIIGHFNLYLSIRTI